MLSQDVYFFYKRDIFFRYMFQCFENKTKQKEWMNETLEIVVVSIVLSQSD